MTVSVRAQHQVRLKLQQAAEATAIGLHVTCLCLQRLFRVRGGLTLRHSISWQQCRLQAAAAGVDASQQCLLCIASIVLHAYSQAKSRAFCSIAALLGTSSIKADKKWVVPALAQAPLMFGFSSISCNCMSHQIDCTLCLTSQATIRFSWRVGSRSCASEPGASSFQLPC